MATIPYADVIDRQLLPVDSQDIVTKVRLVIAGNRAGYSPELLITQEPRGDGGPFSDTVTYYARPIIIEYEAPEHATYGVERSFGLPSGVDPFLSPTDLAVPEPTQVQEMNNPGLPSVIRDGDPTTYATNAAGSAGHIISYSLTGDEARLCVGMRLRHALTLSAAGSDPFGQPDYSFRGARVRRRFGGSSNSDRVTADSRFALTPAANLNDPLEEYLVLPLDARTASENMALSGDYSTLLSIGVSPQIMDEWRVYAFYPLILNEDLLEDIARAQVRLPALLPQRVTVRGYVAPDREHTITGWPGGDYTGIVAQHQYDLGRTVIDFEQAGSPVGLPSEAIEAARERRQAIEGTVATANYDLKMGGRM